MLIVKNAVILMGMKIFNIVQNVKKIYIFSMKQEKEIAQIIAQMGLIMIQIFAQNAMRIVKHVQKALKINMKIVKLVKMINIQQMPKSMIMIKIVYMNVQMVQVLQI